MFRAAGRFFDSLFERERAVMPCVGAGDERGELFKERFALAPARLGEHGLHARAVVRMAAAQELFIVQHRSAVSEILAALIGIEPADMQPCARRNLADAAAEQVVERIKTVHRLVGPHVKEAVKFTK